MTLGAGYFPAGYGFAGYSGTPPTVDEPGPSVGAVFVDENGDYRVDGTGDLVRVTPTMQRAVILLRTELKSYLLDQTIGLDAPREVNQSWEMRMRQSCYSALKPMTDDGSIRIDRVTIERPLPHRARPTVRYTVLDTGAEEEVFA